MDDILDPCLGEWRMVLEGAFKIVGDLVKLGRKKLA
jgi:hypothetical protein